MTYEALVYNIMALQQQTTNRNGQHHCRDCGVYFESSKSLEVHLQYHKENLLTKWANQAASSGTTGPDNENNNVKRNFQNSIAAPADSTEMKTNSSGPGRPSSNSSYPPTTSPFTHPQTPASYSSAPSPYQNDTSGPSPSSTSFGFSGGEQYQMPYNGYRSPCQSNFMMDGSNHQESYILGHNNDFPTAPGNNLRSPTPNSPSSSTSFRYMYKNEGYLDKNGVSSSSPQSPHQCEKCGYICDSQVTLQEHVKTAHPPSPPYTGSAFQAPEFYRDKETVQGSPDILDLDSQQKIHNFRPPEEEQPPPNPHSITSMLSPWTNNIKPQYPVPQQPYRIPPNPQSFPPQPAQPQQNGPVPTPQPFPQQRTYPESFNNVPQPPVPNPNINATQLPNAPSPKLANNPSLQPSGSKGDAWKSNEARRPKTYNCSACNKWFTSSGHLKRHYNTTLHKNAVKQSGHPDPATLPISSHHHPNRDPSYIHSSKTPPGMTNPAPNLGLPKTKKPKAISPVDSNNTPSPALSNANTEDSSRSNDNVYDRNVFDRNLPNGGFDRASAGIHPQTFGNNGFDVSATNATVSQAGFDRQATNQSSFEQRTTPGFDPRNASVQPQNGFAMQEPSRPPSSPNYDYYRDYNRVPPINQINSTNQITTQPPNFQAGPSASPSGGLPICPPSLLFLRTPNPTTIYMGENTTIQRTSDLSQHQEHHTIQQSTNNLTTIGSFHVDETNETAPLPSFSNFQNYNQTFLEQPVYAGGKVFYQSSEFSTNTDYTTGNEFSTNTEFTNEYNPSFFVKSECKSEEFIKLENLDYSYVQDYVPQSLETVKRVKQVSEKECQTSFTYPSAYEIGFKIKKEYVSDSSPPLSPQEFPSSTNLEISEKSIKKKKRNKKPEESSNMVSSTGSPQPAKKEVIKCEECDKTFNRVCYLTQHNRSFHCGEKPFKCDRCGKRFHSENRAKDHSRKHGGEKPYKCDVCPKSFNHKTDLRRHLCLHTGQKPFPCEFCGKGFIRKDHMLKHFHTHKTGKRKFIQTIEEIEAEKNK